MEDSRVAVDHNLLFCWTKNILWIKISEKKMCAHLVRFIKTTKNVKTIVKCCRAWHEHLQMVLKIAYILWWKYRIYLHIYIDCTVQSVPLVIFSKPSSVFSPKEKSMFLFTSPLKPITIGSLPTYVFNTKTDFLFRLHSSTQSISSLSTGFQQINQVVPGYTAPKE